MNKRERHDYLASSFWQYSLALYEKPGVADDLITLQDECGFDVNIILFICWAAAQGMTNIQKQQSDFVFRAAATWQKGVIAPLRAVRRDVGAGDTMDIQSVYKSLKNSELEAEKAAQYSMVACFAQSRLDTHNENEEEIKDQLLRRYLRFIDFSFNDIKHENALERIFNQAV